MYYSVVSGREIGIFLTWPECANAVCDFRGATFRKWPCIAETVRHLNEHGIEHEKINVHTSGCAVPLVAYCTRETIPVPQETPYKHRSLFKLGLRLYVEIVNVQG